MFKSFANFGAMLKQAQQLSSKMEQVQDDLRQRRATGVSGGGLVEVEVNGLGELLRVRIDPQLRAQGDMEMIEDLIPAAANQAIGRSKQLHAEAIQSVAAGMNLPGLDKLNAGASTEPTDDGQPT